MVSRLVSVALMHAWVTLVLGRFHTSRAKRRSLADPSPDIPSCKVGIVARTPASESTGSLIDCAAGPKPSNKEAWARACGTVWATRLQSDTAQTSLAAHKTCKSGRCDGTASTFPGSASASSDTAANGSSNTSGGVGGTTPAEAPLATDSSAVNHSGNGAITGIAAAVLGIVIAVAIAIAVMLWLTRKRWIGYVKPEKQETRPDDAEKSRERKFQIESESEVHQQEGPSSSHHFEPPVSLSFQDSERGGATNPSLNAQQPADDRDVHQPYLITNPHPTFAYNDRAPAGRGPLTPTVQPDDAIDNFSPESPTYEDEERPANYDKIGEHWQQKRPQLNQHERPRSNEEDGQLPREGEDENSPQNEDQHYLSDEDGPAGDEDEELPADDGEQAVSDVEDGRGAYGDGELAHDDRGEALAYNDGQQPMDDEGELSGDDGELAPEDNYEDGSVEQDEQSLDGDDEFEAMNRRSAKPSPLRTGSQYKAFRPESVTPSAYGREPPNSVLQNAVNPPPSSPQHYSVASNPHRDPGFRPSNS